MGYYADRIICPFPLLDDPSKGGRVVWGKGGGKAGSGTSSLPPSRLSVRGGKIKKRRVMLPPRLRYLHSLGTLGALIKYLLERKGEGIQPPAARGGGKSNSLKFERVYPPLAHRAFEHAQKKERG